MFLNEKIRRLKQEIDTLQAENERLREVMRGCGDKAHNLSCTLHYQDGHEEDADELAEIASLLWDLNPADKATAIAQVSHVHDGPLSGRRGNSEGKEQ